MKSYIDQNLKSHKSILEETYSRLLGIIAKVENPELEMTAKEIKKRISEPFLFVIVGEVKAGKSSFINALLEADKDICAVAPSPMTDTIQQIVFGEDKIEFINPFLKKIHQPIDILKEVSIVDTPGTNTIVDHHQEITERFIPSSDLIVFVFEAKNPYRQSAWEFFDFINDEWRKKIIFVLQQKDLMSEENLKINEKGVFDHALKKGIIEPKVFSVSAKLEQNGNNKESGFLPLRKYLQDNITGGKAPYLKLLSTINTSQQLIEKISKGIIDRENQLELDKNFRVDIRSTLDKQEEKSQSKVEQLIENLLNAYDKSTYKALNSLGEGLNILPLFKRSFGSLFGSGKSVKNWLKEVQEQLEKDLNLNLRDKLQEGVVDIADSIQDMGKIVDLKIKASQTVLKNNHEIFSNIAERRANVLKDLQATFSSFLSRSENYYDEDLVNSSKLTPNLAAGGGIAAVGVILTTVTNLAVFDITGGILAAIGLTFAGVSIGWNKRRILSNVKKEVKEGRIRIEEEISEKLNRYIHNIKLKIDENFDQFDQLINEEENEIKDLKDQQNTILNSLNQEKKAIEMSLNSL